MNILNQYIRYKLKAKGRHGVHSPFVYDFVDKCLRKSLPKDVFNAFKLYLNDLKKDKNTIEVTDLGAGSQKLSNSRKIASIAKVSGSGVKYGKLLYKLIDFYQPKNILELGTSLGIGTFMMSKAAPKGKIYTVEGCPNTQSVAKEKLAQFGVKNVHFYHSAFSDFLQSNKIMYDFVFIDGDHRGKSLLQQLNLLAPYIHEKTLIVLDDIRWSQDMLDTWQELVQSKTYNLSIDLFRMGILAQRPKQFKEHFVVNY